MSKPKPPPRVTKEITHKPVPAMGVSPEDVWDRFVVPSVDSGHSHGPTGSTNSIEPFRCLVCKEVGCRGCPEYGVRLCRHLAEYFFGDGVWEYFKAKQLHFVHDDGGRETAGCQEMVDDFMVRAISVCGWEDYREVNLALVKAMEMAGYTPSGGIPAARRRKTAPKRGQPSVAEVRRKVLRDYGFVQIEMSPGLLPPLSAAHEVYGDCIVELKRGNKLYACALVGGQLRDVSDSRYYTDHLRIHGTSFSDEDSIVVRQKRERKAVRVWVRD